MLTKKHRQELKRILEEDFQIKLSNRAVDNIAKFLVSYISLLKKLEME